MGAEKKYKIKEAKFIEKQRRKNFGKNLYFFKEKDFIFYAPYKKN